jgi:hypothetical protein
MTKETTIKMNFTENRLSIGQARIDITPPVKIAMIGHGEGFFTGFKDRLYATSIVFSQGETRVCLITADLIGFKADFSKDVQARIAKATGIKKNNILLCASHTHRGPNIVYQLAKSNNIRYIEELKVKLVELAVKTVGKLCYVSVGSAVGKAAIGINRRLPVNGKIEFAPNPDGVYDKDVMIVAIKSGGKLQGLITSHACHATAEIDSVISADYPGQVRDLLHKEYGAKPIISFLAGCCGDVRPNGTYKKEGWNLPITEQQIQGYSQSVINEVKNIVEDKNPVLNFVHAKLELPFDKERISLSQFETIYSETSKLIRNEATAANIIRALKSLQKSIKLKKAGVDIRPKSMDVAMLQVGKIVFVFLPGEVFTEIGLQIKALDPSLTIIPVTFYNNRCPYICTAKACVEGGVEPMSFSWFGHEFPFAWSASCENIILEKIASMLKTKRGRCQAVSDQNGVTTLTH